MKSPYDAPFTKKLTKRKKGTKQHFERRKELTLRVKRIKRKKKAAKKPKITGTIQVTRRIIPIVNEEEFKRTQKEINATNRQRAKNMERRIATYLKGNRVPASGAMMGMKGDCYIPLVNGGQYLIECKLTEYRDRYGEPRIMLLLRWFDKVLKDSAAMRAKFGVLIIHYQGMREDYVFIPETAMKYIAAHSIHGLIVDCIRNDVRPQDLTFVNGKTRAVYGLYRYALEKSFMVIRGYHATAFTFSSGVWYVMPLSEYRDLLEGV